MAEVLVTLKIMPGSPEENLDILTDKASGLIKAHGGDIHQTSQKEIAFGLKSIEIVFLISESKGSTEGLEKQIAELSGVSSVDVIDVRRAIG
jgi:translation elongation factor aEF-1 beta